MAGDVIVTVTLNAALHVSYAAGDLPADGVRPISRPGYRAGGRGVTAARVLRAFGHDVLVAGLAGGTSGDLIREDLARAGIPTAFTLIRGESRRVFRFAGPDPAGQILRFGEAGPYITTEELGRFAADYRSLLAEAAAVVLCGSLPDGLPPDVYGTLVTYAVEAGVPVILDAGGEELRHAVTHGPDLVVAETGSPTLAPAPRSATPDTASRSAASDSAPRSDTDPRSVPEAVSRSAAPDATLRSAAPDATLRSATPDATLRSATPDTDPRSVSEAVSRTILDAASRSAAEAAPGPDPVGPDLGSLGAALVRLGAGAAAVANGSLVCAVTPAGEWTARITSATGDAPPRAVRGALVAGLVPGQLLGWSWPDRLRHALALAAGGLGDTDRAERSAPAGTISTSAIRDHVDLAAYERLLDAVTVERSP